MEERRRGGLPRARDDDSYDALPRERTDEGGARKSVTMAPTSRYLSDRRYVVRRPLFSADVRQTSILKKHPPLQEAPHTRELWVEGAAERCRRRVSDVVVEPTPRERVGGGGGGGGASSLGTSEASVSPRDPPLSPLALSDLRGSSPRSPAGCGGSGWLGGAAAACPVLGPLHLTSTFLGPPRLTSTLRPPPPLPRARPRAERGAWEPQRQTNLLARPSPSQAAYWACAVPGFPPPSPDRTSRSWDPEREYEALLDYTYPLRPGGGALLRAEPPPLPGLQDSGIELDRLGRSLSLSALDSSPGGAGRPGKLDPARDGGGPPGGRWAEDDDSPGSPGSVAGPGAGATEPWDSGGAGMSHSARDESGAAHEACDRRSRAPAMPRVPGGHFIRSTSVLPRARGTAGGWQWDEEFRPLPDQLEELQVLSRQVWEVTTRLSQPTAASSWGSAEPGSPSPSASLQPEDDAWTDGDGRGTAPSLCEGLATAGRRRAGGSDGGAWAEGQLHAPGEGRPEHQDSLAERLQHLSCPLTELVAWLHTVCDRLASLTPPAQDIDSIKSSLAQYQDIQRDISAHQPLTQAVLHTGDRLLQCMDSTCPVLRDTLGQVERQTAVLETRSEHLFSSILSAMDSLTRASGGGPEARTRDPGSSM